MKACVFPGVFVPLLIVHCRAQFRDLDGCTAADLEACGTDYVIYANATRIAEGGEELEQQCRFFLSQLSCMDKFCSRCLVGITRAVALVGLRSAHEFYDESCWNGTSLYKDYIDSVRCLNKAGPRIHDQLTDVRLKLHSIAETVPGREKVKYACCLFLEQVSCMDKFCSRCLEGIIRAVTLLGLRSSYEFTEEMCTDDSPVNRDYFNAVKCLNKAGAKIREQLVRIRLRLYTIAERAPGRKKIQYACCTYHNNIREITNAIDGVCPDGAGSKFYMSVMDRSFGDLLSIACGGHTQGSAECHALGPITPLETLKPEDAPSFVGPMLAIASSLAET